MLWPLAACLVMTGIHVYLGVHVIARKVIFVDLALAQIAALGTVIGVLLGYEVSKDSTTLYLYSLAFTIFGAFIFSVTKMKTEKVPHEAIIGIVYALAAALMASGFYYFVRTTKSKAAIVRNITQSVGVVTIFVLGILFFRKGEEDPVSITCTSSKTSFPPTE